MFKKLFLVLGLTLFSMMPAYAGALNFSHPSIILACKDLDNLNVLFAIALTRQPTMSEINFSNCLRVKGFGAPVLPAIVDGLERITRTHKDWEGDRFAIFEHIPRSAYLLIYNPDGLDGQVAS